MSGDASGRLPLGRLLGDTLGLAVAGIGVLVAVRTLEVGAMPQYGIAAGVVGLGFEGTLTYLAVTGFET